MKMIQVILQYGERTPSNFKDKGQVLGNAYTSPFQSFQSKLIIKYGLWVGTWPPSLINRNLGIL